MGLRLVIGSCALAAAMVAGGIVAFEARASEHPRTEPSVAAGCVGCHMRDYDGARHHRGREAHSVRRMPQCRARGSRRASSIRSSCPR